MLVFDQTSIGNKLLSFRKKKGLTQTEVAELSGLADIESRTIDITSPTTNTKVNSVKIKAAKILMLIFVILSL